MSGKLGYAILEVGGIQHFILGTGKLKEMLGGSELIESLSREVLDDFCRSRQLTLLSPAQPARPGAGQVLPLQRNAGTLHLLFASADDARQFVQAFGLHALEAWPGLPLFAAVGECDWSKTSLGETRKELGNAINGQRSRQPVASGMRLLPLCQAARLDGLPAVAIELAKDKPESVSLPSQTRRQPELLRNACKRLRKGLPDDISDASLNMSEDLEKLSGGQGKIAFIHIDGNDLGIMFGEALRAIHGDESIGAGEYVSSMHALSAHVEETTGAAFRAALLRVVECARADHLRYGRGPFVIPARPLVLGGDDVTVVVRAGLALMFIDTFVREFERRSREGNKPLSVGVGMVVCPVGYPFLKAFELAEDLLKSAKQLTAGSYRGQVRPSSLDYVVLTNDVENDLASQRAHVATASDGALLTAKPMLLGKGDLMRFVRDGLDVLEKLPRSAVRPAMNECRKGVDAARKAWEQMVKNIQRGLGGRHDSVLLPEYRLKEIFGDAGFFTEVQGKKVTRLGDYLELAHLLPEDAAGRAIYREAE